MVQHRVRVLLPPSRDYRESLHPLRSHRYLLSLPLIFPYSLRTFFASCSLSFSHCHHSLTLNIALSLSLSLFYHTGDPEYQEIGWQIFQSIEKYCKTPVAYSAIQDVTLSEPRWTNSMQSYFFAETIKYLFLLFSPRDTIRLDELVFNTEGHPLPVWK